jgi:hypothetical protein
MEYEQTGSVWRVKDQDTPQIRVLVGPELKAAWVEVLRGRKISQQSAVTALMAWTVKQDPLLQSMLFDQIPETDHADIARIILKRMAGAQISKKPKGK